jgi:hypothetical protein
VIDPAGPIRVMTLLNHAAMNDWETLRGVFTVLSTARLQKLLDVLNERLERGCYERTPSYGLQHRAMLDLGRFVKNRLDEREAAADWPVLAEAEI